MPRISFLVICQVILCCIESYLVSKISFIGKAGIALFYKEYRFLRSGWKTFLFFFALQMIVILVLYFVKKKFPARIANYTATGLLAISIAGLWATFHDFQHTFSHRLLKEQFHLAFYLFWLAWAGSCIFFLVSKSTTTPPPPVAEREFRDLPDN